MIFHNDQCQNIINKHKYFLRKFVKFTFCKIIIPFFVIQNLCLKTMHCNFGKLKLFPMRNHIYLYNYFYIFFRNVL